MKRQNEEKTEEVNEHNIGYACATQDGSSLSVGNTTPLKRRKVFDGIERTKKKNSERHKFGNGVLFIGSLEGELKRGGSMGRNVGNGVRLRREAQCAMPHDISNQDRLRRRVNTNVGPVRCDIRFGFPTVE
jgi:hypothetical protein